MSWVWTPWGVVLVALACCVLFALALWLHWRRTVRLLSRPVAYDSVQSFRAPDGGVFELRRLQAGPSASDEAGGAVPTLLVHGICANHRNLDLHPDNSLARYLAGHGRDVWLLTLRSGRPWRLRDARAPQGFAPMVRHDVPLGIRRVLDQTGQPALDYIGFSMGGMLLYAALGRSVKTEWIRRAVVVGSPGRVGPPRGVPRFLRLVPRALVPRILTGTLGTLLAFAAEWVATPAHRLILNPTNVERGMTKLALVDCVQDVSGPLIADFLKWATSDGRVRVTGEDVLEGLAGVDVPVLFVAGEADHVGPARAVHVAHEAWGRDRPAVDKHLRIVGQASGADEDYGHGDLAVGRRLKSELWPAICQFLAGGDAGGDRSAPRPDASAEPASAERSRA